MINGDWGSGKTFTWRNWVEPFAKEQKLTPVYVSLYGASTLADVDSQLLVALFPTFRGRGWQASGKIAEVTLRYFRLEPEKLQAMLASFFSKKTKALFCFDDLERSQVSIRDLFGYINRFVEHERNKVIVLCHEDEIRDRDPDYARAKEKLIGSTYQQLLDPDAIVNSLVASVDVSTPCREILRKNVGLVAQTFRQSQSNNIRSLKRALAGFALLYEEFPDADDAPQELDAIVLKLVLSLYFDIKRNENAKRELQVIFSASRYAYAEAMVDNGKKNVLVEEFAARYYGGSAFDAPLLPSVFDFVSTGVLIRENFHSEVAALRREIISPPNTPEEKLLESYWKLSDAELTPAAESYLRKLDRDEIDSPLLLLRVVLTLCQLSRVGLIKNKPSDITTKVMASISRLHAAQKLKYEELTYPEFGTGYGEPQDVEFKDVKSFLKSMSAEREESSRKKNITELIGRLPASHDAFIGALTKEQGELAYLRVAVLKYLPPEVFAKQVLQLNPEQIIELRNAFEQRYRSYSKVNEYLSDEYHVLTFLRDKLASHVAESERRSADKGLAVPLTTHTLKVLVATITESLKRLAGHA